MGPRDIRAVRVNILNDTERLIDRVLVYLTSLF